MAAKHSFEDKLSDIADLDTVPLSPIFEMNESTITDSSLLEEQPDVSHQNVQEEKTRQEEGLLSSCDPSVEHVTRPSTLKRYETPPEVLRDQVKVLKTQYEYLLHEHKDLQEFTKLEKQAYHEHCFSEDEVNLLKSELDSVNDKMLHLIQENLNFRNELKTKETEVLNQKKLNMISEKSPKLLKGCVSEIAQILKQNLQNGTEKIIKEYPSLEIMLLNNNDNEEVELLNPDSEDFVNTLEGIKKMIEFVITDNIQLKTELNKLCVNNSILEQNNKQLLEENEQIRNILNSCTEKLHLASIQEQEINDLARSSKAQVQEKEKLLPSCALLDNQDLQIKSLNIKSIDSMQEHFSFIFNELNLLFNNPDIREFRRISFLLKTNEKLVACVNEILSPQNQTILTQTLQTIDDRLKIYDDKYEGVELLVKDLSRNVDQFTVQIEESRTEFQVVQSIKTDFCNKMNNLGEEYDKMHDEYVCLKENVVSLEEENKNLKMQLKHIQHEFEKLMEFKKMTQQKNMCLENKISNFKTDFKNFGILISDVGNIIDSWDIKMGFKNIIDIMDGNQIVFSSVDSSLNLNTQAVLRDVSNKLKVKLLCYDSYVNSIMKELATNTDIQDTTNKLKADMKFLQKTVEEELSNRLLKLESSLVCSKGKAELQCDMCKTNLKDSETNQEYEEISNVLKVDSILKEFKCIVNMFEKYSYSDNHNTQLKKIFHMFLENKQDFPNINQVVDKEIVNSLSNCFDKLDQKLHLSERENSSLMKRVEELDLSIKELENKNQSTRNISMAFKDESENLRNKMLMQVYKSNNFYDNDPAKQLATLKELLVIEVANLDGDENRDDLISCSPKEIWDKFMQSIMKVEKKIQEEYEKSLKEKENSLVSVNKKNKTLQSWINELETENNKMEKKIITLSNNLKNSLNDEANLKATISKVTSENITLKDKLKQVNKLIAAERDSFNNLENNLKSLKEDNEKKREEIINISAKLADMKQNKICRCVKSELNSESRVVGEIEIIKQSELVQELNNKMENILKTSEDNNLCKTSSEVECSVENLNKEKLMLQELLTTDDSKYPDTILDKFYFLKDVAQMVVNKLLELENTQSKIQNTVDSAYTDLNDLKLSLFQLYKEFVPDEKANSYFTDVLSLKKELEDVEEECLQITKRTDKFQNVIESGQSFINGLKEQFIVVKNEMSKRDVLIDDLYKTISDEQIKTAESKSQLQTITKQVNCLLLENKQLKEKIKNLNYQLSDLNKIFSCAIFNNSVEKTDVNEKVNYLNEMLKENINNKAYIIASDEIIGFFSNQCYIMKSYIERLEEKESLSLQKIRLIEDQIKYINVMLSSVLSGTPAEKKDLKEQINYLRYMCKENFEIKCSIAEANDNIIFLSHQCKLMTLYINKVELMLNDLQVQKDQLYYECNHMKKQLTNTNYHLEKSNTVIKNLMSLLPSKSLTSSQALKLVQQIINEHTRLRETEVNFIQKHNKLKETLCQKKEEIMCLNKLNENLKIDLGKYEDHVRNLRSELRTLHSHYQKKLAEGKIESAVSLGKSVSAESGIQTDILCCTQLEQDNQILKNTLNEMNLEIASLKGRIQTRSSPYKRKCDLELALIQAKERIKELNMELLQLRDYNKDLIELCKSQEMCSVPKG